MTNTIEAAERVEENIASLKKILVEQEKIATILGDGSQDEIIENTKELIGINTATARRIRETSE